jgi:HAD superfamily hydrolase (TIGR01509 family)
VIKAIFWDNDGVLVDTERLYLQATQETMAAAGRPLSEADYIEYFLRQGTGAWHLLEGISTDEVARLRHVRNERYSELLRQDACEIEGVNDVLRQLHGRYTMGIVTSSRRDHFELIHERCDLLKYFDFILTSDELPRVKPHPDPYLIAMERAGVGADESVVIEDSERGLQAARAAGIRCIVIPTLLTARSNFDTATRIIDRIEEVPAALLDL